MQWKVTFDLILTKLWNQVKPFLFAGLIPVMRHIGCQFFHFWILGTGKLEGDRKSTFPVCCKFLESFQVCSVCFSLLIKKKKLHPSGMNRGPLACLAETLPLHQRGCVKVPKHIFIMPFSFDHMLPQYFFTDIFFQPNFNSANLFPANFSFGQIFLGPNFLGVFFSVKFFFSAKFFF